MASAGKIKYPNLPMYTDVINNVTWPGWAYEENLWIYKEYCPSLDFIAITDAMTMDRAKFVNQYLGELANIPGNIPFVSECPLMETRPYAEAIGFYDVVYYAGIGGMYFDFTGPDGWMGADENGKNLFLHSIVRSPQNRELLRSYNSSYRALNQLAAKHKMTSNYTWWYLHNQTNWSAGANNKTFNISNTNLTKNRGLIITKFDGDQQVRWGFTSGLTMELLLMYQLGQSGKALYDENYKANIKLRKLSRSCSIGLISQRQMLVQVL